MGREVHMFPDRLEEGHSSPKSCIWRASYALGLSQGGKKGLLESLDPCSALHQTLKKWMSSWREKAKKAVQVWMEE